jgi:hypothetical protein
VRVSDRHTGPQVMAQALRSDDKVSVVTYPEASQISLHSMFIVYTPSFIS